MKFNLSFIISGIIALILLSIICIWLFYPRSSHSFEEVDSIIIQYYNKEYKSISVNKEDERQLIELINRSMIIKLDFMFVGDDCGGDGPSIMVLYKDGTTDYWDKRTDYQYCRYIYKNGLVDKEIIIQNKKLYKLIEDIIEKYE